MHYLSLFFALLLFSACEYDEIVPTKTIATSDTTTTVVSYATQVAPILKNYCASCHDQYSIALDGYSYIESSAIADTSNGAEASILYDKIIEHETTQGVILPTTEKTLILRWIKQGATNN